MIGLNSSGPQGGIPIAISADFQALKKELEKTDNAYVKALIDMFYALGYGPMLEFYVAKQMAGDTQGNDNNVHNALEFAQTVPPR